MNETLDWLEATTLKPKQHQAITLLASGVGPAKVAETVGVDRTQLWKWRNDPTFVAVLNHELSETRQAFQNRIEALSCRAIDVLEGALDKGSLRAAVKILEGQGFLGGKLRAIGPCRPSQVEAQQAGELAAELLEAQGQMSNSTFRYALGICVKPTPVSEAQPLSTGGGDAPG